MRSASLVASILLLAGGVASADPAAQPPLAAAPAVAPVDAAERAQVVEDLAKALQADFVFPEIGEKYAAMLRASLAAGAYDSLTDPEAFAARVTADLQAVSPDGHLGLRLRTSYDGPPRAPPADTPQSARPSGPAGLEEAKMIGTVAYLRFNMFPNEPETASRARAFLLAHQDATAVIIDARPHRGGGLDVMDAILPLLYPARTHLVRMDTRASVAGDGPPDVRPTLERERSAPSVVSHDHIAIPDASHTGLQRVPVYYLTSRRTASAAEHLALALKRTHRAVLIGETTRGAGHYGGVQEIGVRFAAFIPVGRTYDPDTNWDWEGRGVAPDIATGADAALDTALQEAAKAGQTQTAHAQAQ